MKFRLLEKLTSKGSGYCMNPILYISEINHLLLQLNYLILYNNKNTFGAFVSYCLEHHQMLNVIELIFPYHKLNEECKGKDFEVSFYYIKNDDWIIQQ